MCQPIPTLFSLRISFALHYLFIMNDGINNSDFLGLLAAQVTSISYIGHGSAEQDSSPWEYISLDPSILGQIPLNLGDSKPGASIKLTLDDSFSAGVFASTLLSGDKSTKERIHMSAFLRGDVTVCCACPNKKVKATWNVSASLLGTVGSAEACFDGRCASTAWNRSASTKSGTTEKPLDFSYRATFHFNLGPGWVDFSKQRGTSSTTRVTASFDCLDE